MHEETAALQYKDQKAQTVIMKLKYISFYSVAFNSSYRKLLF